MQTLKDKTVLENDIYDFNMSGSVSKKICTIKTTSSRFKRHAFCKDH